MAEIEFCPVCSECGAVQWGQEVNVEPVLLEAEGTEKLLYLQRHEITPSRCIKCGEPFSRVIMPIRLPYRCRQKQIVRAQEACIAVKNCPIKEPISCCWKCPHIRTCVDGCHFDPDTCVRAL